MNEATLDFINQTDKDMQPLVEQIHDILREIEPGYHVEQGWGGLAFHRGEDVSCVMQVFSDHIKLTIRDGHAIHDESDILQGEDEEPYIRIDNGMDILSSEIEDILMKQYELFDANNSDDNFDDSSAY